MAVDILDAAGAGEDSRQRLVKAFVVTADPKRQGVSRSLSEDPPDIVAGEILAPKYDPAALALLVEQSSTLKSNISAIEINVAGFGYRLVPRVSIPSLEDAAKDPQKAALREEITSERRKITNKLMIFGRGRQKSLTGLRRRLRRHRATYGNAFLEVIRNPATNLPVAGKALNPTQMFILRQEPEMTTHTVVYPQVEPDGSISYIEVQEQTRFRRYVQINSELYDPNAVTPDGSGEMDGVRFFKEYGDPRVMDSRTGAYIERAQLEDWDGEGNPMPEDRKASEVYHIGEGESELSPYASPSWIGAMVSVLGARSAEEVNFYTIRNNNVPSLALLVSNGRLSQASVDRISEYISDLSSGNANYSGILILEAEGEWGGEDANNVKIDVKPLSESQVRDALFGGYIDASNARIRESMRVSPIYSGIVGDYNRATAEVARRLTDEQVFQPERDEDDEFYNNILFAEWNIRYWRFASRTPNVTDNTALVAMLASAERTGGVTPRISRAVVEEVFVAAADAPPLDPEVNPDIPFSMTLAREVKNQADPTEIGQTVAPVQGPVVPTLKSVQDDLVSWVLGLGDRSADVLKALLRDDEG